MKILIVDNTEPADKHYNYPLVKALSKFSDLGVVNHGSLPPEDEIRLLYDCVILSGVPLHYSFESIYGRQEVAAQVLKAGKAVLGICLGHEAIGINYGSRVIQDEEAEVGRVGIEITRDDPVFINLASGFKIKTSHRASITLPQEFDLLARTTRCNNVIMKHRSKDIYGFQFHPEFSPIGRVLLRNFVNIVATPRREERMPITEELVA